MGLSRRDPHQQRLSFFLAQTTKGFQHILTFPLENQNDFWKLALGWLLKFLTEKEIGWWKLALVPLILGGDPSCTLSGVPQTKPAWCFWLASQDPRCEILHTWSSSGRFLPGPPLGDWSYLRCTQPAFWSFNRACRGKRPSGRVERARYTSWVPLSTSCSMSLFELSYLTFYFS